MMDPMFIWGFRLFDHPWGGFLTGLAVLSLLCVITGDFTSHLARRLNRKVYGKYRDEMVRQHNLSVEALKHSDKDAYKAVNRQAHEAFGKYFFSQAGAFTLSIWPLPFAMAWLDIRFGGIPITLPFAVPGVGDSVFYPFFFFPYTLPCGFLRKNNAPFSILSAHTGLEQARQRNADGSLHGFAQAFDRGSP